MSSKFLRHALLASSLVATAIGFAPAAFAGAGGIAGSASFSSNSTGVSGAATAAAIGQNGASAWSFNDGSASAKNSAGAIGTAGATTITGFSNTGTITSVVDTPSANPSISNTNTLTGAPDIQFGTDYKVDAP